MAGQGGGMLKLREWIVRRGRRTNTPLFVVFSSLVHETIVLNNLIKLTKIKTNMQVFKIFFFFFFKKEGFIYTILPHLTLFAS